MRKAASNVELRRGVAIDETAESVRRCDTWGPLRDGEPKTQRAKPAGAAPGRMSGGELTTVATIDGPLRGDFLFSLGSVGEGEGEGEGWFRACRGSEHDLSGRKCAEPATFNFAAPEYAPLSDTYASLSDAFNVKIG
jgi:hypothetical protein